MKFPKPPAGQMITGYHPQVGLPKDADGRLLLAFEFGPIVKQRQAIEEPAKVRRGVPRPAQGQLL